MPDLVELVIDSLHAGEEGLSDHHLNKDTPHTPTERKVGNKR